MSRRDLHDTVLKNDNPEDNRDYNALPGAVENQLHPTAYAASPGTCFANMPVTSSTAGRYGTCTPAVPAGYYEPQQYADAADPAMYHPPAPALHGPSPASSYSLAPAVPAAAAAQAAYFQDSYATPPAYAAASSPQHMAHGLSTASPASSSASSRGSKRPGHSSASSSRSRSRGCSLSRPPKPATAVRPPPAPPVQPDTSTFPVSPTASSRPQLRTASRAPKRYSPATVALRRPAENEDEERSRSLHNLAEQNYRQRLNGEYGDLLNVLPDEDDYDEDDDDDDNNNNNNNSGYGGVKGYKGPAGFADKKRVSKAQVLDRATRRIKALEEEGEELQRRRLELEYMEALYGEGCREGLYWGGGEDGNAGQGP